MLTHARGTRTQWISAVVAVLAALAAVLTAPTVAHAATRDAGTVRQGLSQPDYSYADAIRESVWVDTGLDGDADGRTDRVAVDIVRPSEPAKAGRKIPVIMDASPYYSCCGRGNESQLKTYDANGHIVQAPLFYDNYFVPRGYAAVLVDLAGTNRSDGCVDVGGRSDIQSAKAVVDWLNGRAKGYSARAGGQSVTASWTTGAVGMIGKSWDGTIANGVAVTGVRGLKTIVPISAISSWYDYSFHQGAPLQDGPEWLSDYVETPDARTHCAAQQQKIIDGSPRTGDWTPFWTQRDYVKDADNVRASVFAVHGMQDLNVRTKNFGQWWDALAAHGVERKVWLSQTGHVDPFDTRRTAWVPTLQRWFDHYLLGVRNGIEREPMADIERTPDQWTTDRVWPPAGTSATALNLRSGTTPGVGTLGLKPAAHGSTESFTDDPKLGEEDWASAADASTSAKTAFTTGTLTKDLRLSGSGSVTVTATSSTTSAHLSAVLVDLGPATIRNYLGAKEGIVNLTTRSCFGDSTAGDSACFLDTAADTTTVSHAVFSRGWADVGHFASLSHGVPLVPGKPYTITLKLAATDHVIPAGHRLAVIIAGTDNGLILPPGTTPKVTVDLARSGVRLPLVGGYGALRTSAATAAPQARGPQLPAAPRPFFERIPAAARLG
ncbi:Xaa-Pro dipeptidyl-peptidase [Streptomyces sp. H10-C2]|uniref:Xaa-Pro dipeptidyl-peptidase n=1 Tax=unclassified Streptomyces TaxID=2593676 RepID=UPI0024BBA3C9|nr:MULTISPECIES: Xaa-Pro dipeptidyl-peptidase [unclassified Streptomyces]MDJ0345927.1 Xaa-Pro dipeptidyl-peptidase [Streptomyces sp. PH10-H1]MDJ0374776.1 Xaa-Pro dipeptidyl-peptidase [Streptomyces sp. H10-C2]